MPTMTLPKIEFGNASDFDQKYCLFLRQKFLFRRNNSLFR
jgi:hypothetical protein